MSLSIIPPRRVKTEGNFRGTVVCAPVNAVNGKELAFRMRSYNRRSFYDAIIDEKKSKNKDEWDGEYT